MPQLPSVKKIDQDLTTSSTWEDADGATIDLTVDDQSDILLIATIQATGSVSAEGGWRLVFDGTNYLQSLRQVDSEPANITLVDLVPNKLAGTYTFKLQHQIASGTLTTGVMLVAVSLHNGDGAVPANSAYVASDTVGNAWEDIPGLTCDVTLSKTSHIWAMMVFHGYHSGANKRGTFAINIDATRMEENARDWGPANQNGAVAIATRTDTEKTAGTYTVKGEWLGQGGTTLTGEDFSLVVIGAEADSGNAGIDIQKDVVASDTTTATALEDITGLSVTSDLGETAHVLAILTLSTDVSVNNRSAYCTVQIDGTDYSVMERGHAVQQRKGSIGHVVRTDTALSSGDRINNGRWYTDSGNTLTGAGICLTSIVLAATSPTKTLDYTIDTYLQKEFTTSYTLDTLLQIELTDSYTLDTLLQIEVTDPYTLDAYLQAEFTTSYTLDTRIVFVVTLGYTLDTYLQTKDITTSYTLDVFIEQERTTSYTLDVILSTLATILDYTLDIFLEETKTSIYTLDTFLQNTFTDIYTLDVYLLDELTQTYTLDVFLQTTFTTTYNLDSYLQSVLTITYTLDVYIQSEITTIYTIDTYLQTTTTTTYDLDIVLLLIPRLTYTIDVLLAKTIIQTYSLDSYFQSEKTVTYTLDIVLTLLEAGQYGRISIKTDVDTINTLI